MAGTSGTANTLAWLAGGLLLLGGLVPAPPAQAGAALLSSLSALAALLSGTGRVRAAAAVLLALGILLLADSGPRAADAWQTYRSHHAGP